jgi:hypothetical protein
VSLWLAAARADLALETLAARLAALDAFVAGLDARLGVAGVAGRAEALAVHARLAAVLAVVDTTDVAALRRAIATLERELDFAARTLARLREAKAAFEPEAARTPRVR